MDWAAGDYAELHVHAANIFSGNDEFFRTGVGSGQVSPNPSLAHRAERLHRGAAVKARFRDRTRSGEPQLANAHGRS